MRVQIIDPSAQTPPFDRALSAALVHAGADVELLTSHFSHGAVPPAEGYEAREIFYRRSSGLASGSVGRRAVGLAEHVPGMLRARKLGAAADVVHYQWLTLPGVDASLLPSKPKKVWTAHGMLRDAESSGPGSLAASLRALEQMDAIVALSDYGAQKLRDAGVDSAKIEVIPHGAFDYLAAQPRGPLPAELEGAEGPVVLMFGLIRPYKGADVLLRAFAELGEGAELWIVGRPLGMEMDELHELAASCPGRVRFLSRFVADEELPAIMDRADIVTLPYRDAEQSGVLATALAFGKPIVASAVGGFPEVAAEGAGDTIRLVEPGSAQDLATALRELIDDAEARKALARSAAAVAAGPYSWDEVARQTIALYNRLGAR